MFIFCITVPQENPRPVLIGVKLFICNILIHVCFAILFVSLFLISDRKWFPFEKIASDRSIEDFFVSST